MKFKKFYYLMRVQYNGAKYFGWQKQTPDIPTVHQYFDKAFRQFFKEEKYKTLASSRTDARVHALGQGCLLITYNAIEDLDELKTKVNSYLADDIKINLIENVPLTFRIINDVLDKEYFYLFSNEQNFNDEQTQFVNIDEKLDIKKMQEACKQFLGEHSFKNFQFKPTENKTFTRSIFECEIIENPQFINTEDFPEKLYALRIKGNGFLRNMIRIIMGSLFNVGLNKISEDDIKLALDFPDDYIKVGFIAPAAGLYLNYINYDEESFKFQ